MNVLDEITNDMYNDYMSNGIEDFITIQFGDLITYNSNTKQFEVISSLYCRKDIEHVTIGVIINQNEDDSLDVLLKNYITSIPERVPLTYITKQKHIGIYLKNMFERYITKYVRLSNIDINDLNFYIPNIQLLDRVYDNLNNLKDVFEKLFTEEQYKTFFDRLYSNGVLSTYKGKYYQWLPVMNNKREINNLMAGNVYEFLPIFNIKIEKVNN